jgi:uncharacterized DUF497 family protein
MSHFEWDEDKNLRNIKKHAVSFDVAQYAFWDKDRIILHDALHSETEERWFCIGKVGSDIITVRFSYRKNKIRIFGAGIWRKWRKYYEQENTK